MKQYLFVILLVIISSFTLLIPVHAQGTGDPNADPNELPDFVEQGGFTEGDEVANDIIEEEKNQDKINTSDDFITGAAVGIGFGLIVGIILGWLFKDKLV